MLRSLIYYKQPSFSPMDQLFKVGDHGLLLHVLCAISVADVETKMFFCILWTVLVSSKPLCYTLPLSLIIYNEPQTQEIYESNQLYAIYN